MLETWKSLSPPVSEEDFKGKWQAAIFEQDGKQIMCVGRVIRRLLTEKDGQVTHMELDCLKPKVGNGNILEGYPDGQSDHYAFPIHNVFGGPLQSELVPKKKAWRFPDLDTVEDFYKKVKDFKRELALEKIV